MIRLLEQQIDELAAEADLDMRCMLRSETALKCAYQKAAIKRDRCWRAERKLREAERYPGGVAELIAEGQAILRGEI